MRHKTTCLSIRITLLMFLFSCATALCQDLPKSKMEQLHFMVGEWLGTSQTYEGGALVKEIPAYQHIRYDLDKSILVIELNSASLQLHTIIYYDHKAQQYYYYPFSKHGVAKYPAEFLDGKFIVWPSKEKRFVFGKTATGEFSEYGERLVNGEWERYFIDTFTNTK